MRTVPEIREAFGEASAGILTGHMDALDAIRAETAPEDGRYLDRLPPQERLALMREQKGERAREGADRAREAYADALDSYQTELSERSDFLRGRLFGVGDAGALSRAALATDAELGTLLEVAAHAGNAELGRAVFVAAEQRGLGDLMARYFDRVDPEARDLYGEWAEVPPADVLERQRENAGTLIPDPDPDRLTAPARATT